MSDAGQAAVARWMDEHDREIYGYVVSRFTKRGLARAAARGVKFGAPHVFRGMPPPGSAHAAHIDLADARAARVRPYIEAAISAGAKSLHQIAAVLTAQ